MNFRYVVLYIILLQFLCQVANCQWRIESLSAPRSALSSAVVLNEFVLFAGGQENSGAVDTVDIFWDGNFTLWPSQKNLVLQKPRFAMASASSASCAYFAGGKSDIEVYDIVDEFCIYYYPHIDEINFVNKSFALSEARFTLASAYSENIMAFGGGMSKTGISSRIDVYDTRNTPWQPPFVLELSSVRWGLAGAAVQSNNGSTFILFAGGEGEHQLMLKTIDIFEVRLIEDIITPSSHLEVIRTLQTDMNVPRGWMGIVPSHLTQSDLSSGRMNEVIIAGGYRNDFTSGQSIDSVEKWVADFDHLDQVVMLDYQLNPDRFSPGAAYVNSSDSFEERAACFGGGTSKLPTQVRETETNAVDCFDFDRNRWRTFHMNKARRSLAAAGTSRYFYFAGGILDDDGTMTESVDILDWYFQRSPHSENSGWSVGTWLLVTLLPSCVMLCVLCILPTLQKLFALLFIVVFVEIAFLWYYRMMKIVKREQRRRARRARRSENLRQMRTIPSNLDSSGQLAVQNVFEDDEVEGQEIGNAVLEEEEEDDDEEAIDDGNAVKIVSPTQDGFSYLQDDDDEDLLPG